MSKEAKLFIKERAKDFNYLSELMQSYADQEVNKANDLLENFKIGFEWDIENKPETIDKSDYEFYDQVKEYLESIKPKHQL